MNLLIKLAAAATLLVCGLPAPCADKMVVLLIGAPGSGKTTQSKKISAEYGIPSISMSDILKMQQGHGMAKLSEQKKIDKRLKASVASGAMVSSEVASGLVRDRIMMKDAARGFVLDGFPSTREEADSLEKTIAELGLPKPVVVDLVISDREALARMSARGRADDKAGLSEPRLNDFRKEEQAILDYYPDAIKVDASKSEGEVWATVKKALAAR